MIQNEIKNKIAAVVSLLCTVTVTQIYAGGTERDAACVDARDLKESIGDRVHYSKEAQIEIGKRFTTAYLKLINAEEGQESEK